MRSISLTILAAIVGPLAVGQFLPQIQLKPVHAAVASGQLTLTVSGSNFTPSLQILWNGQPRATKFVNSLTLKATILDRDLSSPGLAQVSLSDSTSNAPASPSAAFLIYVPLQANDLIYDPQRSVVYVSVSKQDPNGPAVAVVDPTNGIGQRYIITPSEPGVLAISDDSHYLYVALTDRVRRMDLTGTTSDVDILFSSLAQWNGGPVISMLPLLGQETSVVISGAEQGQTFIVDGIQPRQGHANEGLVCVSGTPDGVTFYGSGQGGSSSAFIALTLSPTGFPFTPQQSITGLLSGFSCPVYADGLLYDGGSDILNPATEKLLGRFGAWGLVRPVPELNRTYFVGAGTASPAILNPPTSLMVFDKTSLQKLQSISLPVSMNLFSGRLIHWGTDGLGFAEFQSSNGGPSSWIYLFHAPSQ